MRAEAEGFEPPDPCESSVFKTDAFDHSATPPAEVVGLFDGADSVKPTHVRSEHFGNNHRPVGLLVVLQNGDEGAANRESGTVDRVGDHRLAARGRPKAHFGTPGLEVTEMGAA